MSTKINPSRNHHSSQCIYKDTDNLAYADMELNGLRITVSANEVSFFDELLKSAKDGDQNVSIDFETGDHFAYGIIYGGLIVSKLLAHECQDTDEIVMTLKDYFNKSDGCALAVIDDNWQNMVVNVFHDIYIDTKKCNWKTELQIPFAALIQTDKDINNSPCPITYFFLPKGLLWECMVNRPCLFAARAIQPLKEDQIASWQEYIDTTKLYEAYENCDLVFVDDENE